MRASKLIGTNVTNAVNESVGELDDIVLGKDGNAVIVSVGGFLGIGEREVAISPTGLKFARDSNGRDHARRDQESIEGRAGLEVGFQHGHFEQSRSDAQARRDAIRPPQAHPQARSASAARPARRSV